MRIRPMFGALAFLAAASLGGCVDNDVSLAITKFIPPDPASLTSGMCKFDPATTFLQSRGTYDLNLAKVTGDGYIANFVVSNNLLALANAPVDSQYYDVSSFDVTLDVSKDIEAAIPPTARSFSVQTGTFRLVPGATAAANAQVIAPQYIQSLIDLQVPDPGTITAHIRPVATRGQDQVTGAYATFPIDVCNNCLGGKTFRACPFPAGSTPSNGDVCNRAQDFPIDCCVDSTSRVLCGSAAPKATM
jgi:hypothetical protein